MARTTKKKATTTRKRAAARTQVSAPSRLKVVAGGKKAMRQGPKPGRETARKTTRKRVTRPKYAADFSDVPITLDEKKFPEGFADLILRMAKSKEGVTLTFIQRRGGNQFGYVGWRRWLMNLAEKNGLQYNASPGRPVFTFTKPAAARKRA